MTRAQAIATLTIGEPYQRLWRTHCEPGWRRYAERHAYDLVVVDAPLDDSDRARGRSPAWQKLLVLGHPALRDRERVVWIDAEVLIHPAAPDVAAGVASDRVGGVDEYATPTPAIHAHALRAWRRIVAAEARAVPSVLTARQRYLAADFAAAFDQVIQTGVLVLSPRHHRHLLEQVYARDEPRPGADLLGESVPLSHAVLRHRSVHWLDARFNLPWAIQCAARFPFLLADPQHPLAARCAAQALADSYFLHFAGAPSDVALVNQSCPPPHPLWRRAAGLASPAPEPCRAPVALLLYNRPEPAARVFAAIRAARPRQLFVIADGPRADRPGDAERCAAARAVAETVDWDCVPRWNAAPANLGLKRRVESGLDWLFAQVERAIILEDDCLPEPTFFRFCDELLTRYADDARVMAIGGPDLTFGLREGDAASYAFSRYPLIWGWATWRRAWSGHDPTMRDWPAALAAGWLRTQLDDARAADYWAYVIDESFRAGDTWDYAWTFSTWRRGSLSIHPQVNLVSNIGFGGAASHTRDGRDALAEMATEPMEFPLRHPPTVASDHARDALLDQIVFSGALERVWRRLRARRR